MKPSRLSYPASAKDSDRGTSEFLPKTQSSVNFQLPTCWLCTSVCLPTTTYRRKDFLNCICQKPLWNFLTLETAAALIRVSISYYNWASRVLESPAKATSPSGIPHAWPVAIFPTIFTCAKLLRPSLVWNAPMLGIMKILIKILLYSVKTPQF